MSSNSSSMSPIFIKSSVAGITAAALDRFVCKEESLYMNLAFGASTAAGGAAGAYLSSIFPALIPDSNSGLYTGRGIMDRTLEVAGGYSATYILAKFMTESKSCPITTKILVAVASNFIGEYVGDYMLVQPLSYLQ